MSFGNILKKLRQDENLTQEELARRINSSRSNIANYENDKNMPSVDMLNKLSKIFDCTIDYLLGNSNIRNFEQISINEEDIAFASKVKSLSETDKMIIKTTLDTLLAKQERNKKDSI